MFSLQSMPYEALTAEHNNWIWEYEAFSNYNVISINIINYIIWCAMKESLFYFLAYHKGRLTSVYGIHLIYVAQLATVMHEMGLLQSWLQVVNSKLSASHWG